MGCQFAPGPSLSAPAKDKPKVSESGATTIALEQFLRTQRFEQLRNASSLILFVAACAMWLLSFARMGVSQEGLPWYITIGIIASMSVRFLKVENSFSNLAGLPRSREPMQLQESLAICFMLVAVGLYCWVGYTLIHPPVNRVRLTQIVDIQLLSERDYSNEKELLPGTEPQDDLRKRVAETVSRTGSILESKATPPQAKNTKKDASADRQDKKTAKSNGKAKTERENEKAAEIAATPKPVEKMLEPIEATPVSMPSTWMTKTISSQFLPAASRSSSVAQPQSDNQPYISEVAPPEMVELMENDGDANAMHVAQSGGKSSGGKGAENTLSEYLRQLHRRIKNAWTPPRGNNRAVEVLFRLKRDGHPAYLKITRSSGETLADTSATKAIIAALTNALPLPKDYPHSYLDVRYTFRYNVDELRETTPPESTEN